MYEACRIQTNFSAFLYFFYKNVTNCAQEGQIFSKIPRKRMPTPTVRTVAKISLFRLLVVLLLPAVASLMLADTKADHHTSVVKKTKENVVIKNFLALNNNYSGLSTAKLNITKAEAMLQLNVTLNYHELSTKVGTVFMRLFGYPYNNDLVITHM